MSDESPQARVNYYVERQVKVRKAHGDTADVEEIRRGTARLLEIADAQARAHPVKDRAGEKTSAEVHESKRKLGPEAQAAASGTEFFYRNEAVEPLISKPKPAPRVPTGLEGEKHVALLRRIKQLMRKVPGYKIKPGESLYAGHVFPRFAQLLDQHTRNAALTDPGSHGLGSYAEMPLSDRQRKYYRFLEDICTASDKLFPRGWFVPR